MKQPHRHTLAATACAALCLGFGLAESVDAGAVLLHQTRSLRATARVEDFSTGIITRTDFKEATDFGAFNTEAVAAADLVVPEMPGRIAFSDGRPNVAAGFARATMTSQLSPTLFTASGAVGFASQDTLQGSQLCEADMFFKVTFRLDEPHRVELIDPGPGDVELLKQGEGPIASNFFDGVLDPGVYTLKHALHVEGISTVDNQHYELTMSVNAIPLPPGVWSGLGGLVTAGAYLALRARETAR